MQQLQRLKQQHGLTLQVGIEIEFHLLRAVPGSSPLAYEAWVHALLRGLLLLALGRLGRGVVEPD